MIPTAAEHVDSFILESKDCVGWSRTRYMLTKIEKHLKENNALHEDCHKEAFLRELVKKSDALPAKVCREIERQSSGKYIDGGSEYNSIFDDLVEFFTGENVPERYQDENGDFDEAFLEHLEDEIASGMALHNHVTF